MQRGAYEKAYIFLSTSVIDICKFKRLSWYITEIFIELNLVWHKVKKDQLLGSASLICGIAKHHLMTSAQKYLLSFS